MCRREGAGGGGGGGRVAEKMFPESNLKILGPITWRTSAWAENSSPVGANRAENSSPD